MARSAWRLEAQDNFILVDTGILMVSTSDKSSLVLLKDAVLGFPVEYPADSESTHAGHVWYWFTDVVGPEYCMALSISSVHLSSPANRRDRVAVRTEFH